MARKNSLAPNNMSVRIYTSKLLKRQWLSKKAFEVELTRPPLFEFSPGQCICFIYEAIQRYYSLICTPGDSTLRICVHSVENGIFSPLLAAAKMGTRFDFTGPHGYFTFRPSRRTPVFIATGTGIAPFLSMGSSGVAGFIILHEVETPEELYYASSFRTFAKRYVPCISEISPGSKEPPGIYSGNAVKYLSEQLPPDHYDFYLCGQEKMIREVTLLVDEQFPGSLIFREVYY
ncbi:MAG: FAD-binding oxidoreductase [Desulfobacterales bacterium]|jgi:ferredoxin-NADP reductase